MVTPKPAPNEKRRDSQAHQEILNATSALLDELGYKKLSIEAIAARAGVGKQTIYRWWKGKADLVIEAFTQEAQIRAPEPDAGALEQDLRVILLFIFKEASEYSRGTGLAAKSMMAEAQLDHDFLPTFLNLIRSWHGPFRHALEHGKARGELRSDTDLDAMVDMLMGATWYRLLLEHAPLDEAYADTIIRTLLEGSRPSSST